MANEKGQTPRNNVAVFAHYDKDKVIDDYVFFYLEELKKVVSKIVFVSDCDVQEKYKDKVLKICDHAICKRHGEYDFGSYKRGIEFLSNEIFEYTELILLNDSCYGPITPLESIFREMEDKKKDFWGITCSSERGTNHLQSYFMSFSSKVFSSQIFQNFFSNIKTLSSKEEVINLYEITLTNILEKQGYSWCSYNEYLSDKNPVMIDCLVKKSFENKNCPFLKVTLVKSDPELSLSKKYFFSLLPKKILFIKSNKIIISKDLMFEWREYVNAKLMIMIENHNARVNDIKYKRDIAGYILFKELISFNLRNDIYKIKFLGITILKKQVSFKYGI